MFAVYVGRRSIDLAKAAAGVVSEYSVCLHTARIRSSHLLPDVLRPEVQRKVGSSEVHTGDVLPLPKALPRFRVEETGFSDLGRALVEHKVLGCSRASTYLAQLAVYARLGMKLDASR